MKIKTVRNFNKKIPKKIIKEAHKEIINAWELKKYTKDESFIYTPFDKKSLITTIYTLKQKKVSQTKLVIVIGIGGSSLGAKALTNAVKKTEKDIKICFLESIEGDSLEKVKEQITKMSNNKQSILVFLISKSGKTLETITNYSFLNQYFPFIKERTIVITEKDSPLYTLQFLSKIPLPKYIGGRFSVFTAVGLAPLIVSKVNILRFLAGAQKEAKEFLINPISSNAVKTAYFKYYHFKKGKKITVTFPFDSSLEDLNKWYSQLLAESLGKKKNGFTPVKAIGTTDMHSLGQLFLGGPKDKIFEFIEFYRNKEKDIKIESPIELIPEIKNKTLEQIKKAIFEGVITDFKKHNLPFIKISFEQENNLEEEIGRYMMFKMIETYILGKFLEINPFGQPNVESYKKNSISNLKRT